MFYVQIYIYHEISTGDMVYNKYKGNNQLKKGKEKQKNRDKNPENSRSFSVTKN